MIDIISGAIGHSNDKRDFLIGNLWIDLDVLPTIKRDKLPQVNQWKFIKSTNACTIVNAYKDLCYLWDKECNDKEMLEFIDRAVANMKYITGNGWYSSSWMNAVYKWWNKKYTWMLSNYVLITLQDIPKVLSKWYMVGCTYRGNSSYNNDYRKDYKLDWDSFWSPTYWHRTSIYQKNNKILN